MVFFKISYSFVASLLVLLYIAKMSTYFLNDTNKSPTHFLMAMPGNQNTSSVHIIFFMRIASLTNVRCTYISGRVYACALLRVCVCVRVYEVFK